MLGLDDLEIGCIVHAGPQLSADLQAARQMEIRGGPIEFPAELPLAGLATETDRALTDEQFTAAAAVVRFSGEDHSSIPAISQTVGLVPPKTREERVARVKEVSRAARELAIDALTCDLGMFSLDAAEPAYGEVRSTLLELCRFCHKNGQSLMIKAGTEPPKVLLRLIEDVHHPGLRINFNPGNMIRYGTGDPIESLKLFGKYIGAVTCTDGDWPLMESPATLGERRPIGEGKIVWPSFLTALKEAGYRGLLTIDPAEKDKRKAAGFLRELTRIPAAQAEES